MSTQTTPAAPTTPPTGDGLRHPWLLVARREVATKLADRTFLIGTLLTLAMILGFVIVQAVLSERTQTYELVATASAAPMADAVAQQAPPSTTIWSSTSCRLLMTPLPRRPCSTTRRTRGSRRATVRGC